MTSGSFQEKKNSANGQERKTLQTNQQKDCQPTLIKTMSEEEWTFRAFQNPFSSEPCGITIISDFDLRSFLLIFSAISL